jgi:hypothetical protein
MSVIIAPRPMEVQQTVTKCNNLFFCFQIIQIFSVEFYCSCILEIILVFWSDFAVFCQKSQLHSICILALSFPKECPYSRLSHYNRFLVEVKKCFQNTK